MEKRNLITIPVIVNDFRPRKDRSWRVTFETRELSGEQVKLLTESYQGEGWLLFSPNSELSAGDIPDDAADTGVKTPSERYRSKLYIFWKQHGGLDALGSFDNFYREHYAQLDEVLNTKLEPKED